MDEVKKNEIGRSLVKGLVAGLIGGLVAAAAKTLAERIYPPRTHGEPELAGHELAVREETVAAEAIHWRFGALTGAAYGALAEFYPAATAKDGAGFGMALASLTHDGALPAMGLPAPHEEHTMRERTSEMASHAVFGMMTETVRRVVRKALG